MILSPRSEDGLPNGYSHSTSGPLHAFFRKETTTAAKMTGGDNKRHTFAGGEKHPGAAAVPSKTNLSRCPCEGSDQDSYKIKCSSCKQHWHTPCANLSCKSFEEKTILELQKTWHCPWCHVTPFIRPSGHPSFKNESVILGTVVSDAVSAKISEEMQIAHTLSSESIRDTIALAIKTTLEPITDSINKRLGELLKPTGMAIRGSTEGEEQKPQTEEVQVVRSNPTKYIQHHEDNFIGDELSNELSEFLKTVKYSEVNGRSVASYGEDYNYSGRPDNNVKEIPAPIKKLMDLVNQELKQFTSSKSINQVIVNRYKDGSSYLPKHSDSEREIMPDSEIFTVSLGCTRTMVFRDESMKPDTDNRDQELEVSDGSIYVMSQPSQSFWSHRMDTTTDEDLPERVSITFRTVGANFKNSTVIIGDSNTKHLRFSSGQAKEKGTFGYMLPGKRVEAFHLRTINPEDCIGYQNVILHCGVNDIRNRSPGRLPDDPEPDDIGSNFRILRQKVVDIRTLCPKISIFISPLLPTKSLHLNRRVINFNEHLTEFLSNDLKSEGVRSFNFNPLVDWKTGVLREEYGVYDTQNKCYNTKDSLHLGKSGIRLLAKTLRDGVLQRRVTSTSYRRVLDSTPGNFRNHARKPW